ncbi:MAG: divalent-cation tolerance protein CutA [Rhodospirillales bacterium]|nr:divalent-cation tolerance protein CutA [Rhodospirillales bacterium]
MSQCLVYMTAPNDDEAIAIARALVDEQLAACVNIMGAMRSVYRWQGKIQEDAEIVLIAKTRRDLVPALTEKIRDIHSYDCPCVVSLSIDGGNPEFLAWIDGQTRSHTP